MDIFSTSGIVLFGLRLLYLLVAIVVPIFIAKSFWKNWVAYVRSEFFSKQKYSVLELRIPKGITKSPLAMEVFITSLFQPGGEGDWITKYWDGSVRSWFSLELVSIDGLASGSVFPGEVATLDHESRDDSVERRSLVVEGLA